MKREILEQLLAARANRQAVALMPRFDAIVSDLVGQGMNASTDEVGNSTYSILGDSDSNVPAQYNLMTNEAWISVISILGGETFYRENVVIAGETLDNVYN